MTAHDDADLVYAATAWCVCGAGLAYAPGADHWDCSALLTGRAIASDEPGAVDHTAPLPFALYTVLGADDPRAQGITTRRTREDD